jgi:hypothetical protein
MEGNVQRDRYISHSELPGTNTGPWTGLHTGRGRRGGVNDSRAKAHLEAMLAWTVGPSGLPRT